MTCGIYLITTVDGRRYIGKSINIESRIKGHKWRSLMQSLDILEECSKNELDSAEWSWIDRLKPELNRVLPSIDSSGRKRWDNLGVKESAQSRFGDRAQASKRNPRRQGIFNRLNEFIDGRGLTRYQFAKHVGITENTVYGLCSNQSRIPDAKVMTKICNVYPGIEPNDLMGFWDGEE